MTRAEPREPTGFEDFAASSSSDPLTSRENADPVLLIGETGSRWCPWCREPLPDADPRRSFCSTSCRQAVHRAGGRELLAARLERTAAALGTLGRGELADVTARRNRWRAAALRGEPVGAPPTDEAEVEREVREATARAAQLIREGAGPVLDIPEVSTEEPSSKGARRE